MVTGGEHDDVAICSGDIDNAFCFSSSCLGHGRFENMADILLVRADSFDAGATRNIASEINSLNGKLQAEGRPYLLVGPGRWGSADRWLGIPVQWRDISSVGAIVELQNEQLHADPSQGSHFFQNITSLGIPYLTLKEEKGGGSAVCNSKKRGDCLQWDWLMEKEIYDDGPFIRHIRLDRPFVMKCNGKEEEAVLYRKGDDGKCAEKKS